MTEKRKLGTLAEEFEKSAESALPGVFQAVARNAFYLGAAVALIKTFQGEDTAGDIRAMLEEVKEYDSLKALDKAQPDEKIVN